MLHPSNEMWLNIICNFCSLGGGYEAGVEQGPLHPSNENVVTCDVTSKETELFQHYYL